MFIKFGKLSSRKKLKAASPPVPTPTYKQDFTLWTPLGSDTQLTTHSISGTKAAADGQEIASIAVSNYNNVPWKLKNNGASQINLATRTSNSLMNTYLINIGENEIDLSSDISAGADNLLLYTDAGSEISYSLEEIPTV